MNNKENRIVIGVDPGYGIVGYGILVREERKVIPLDYGCIRTDKDDGDHAERLHKIYLDLSSLIDRYNPGSMAVEELFFARNTTTALKVSEAKGVILLAAAVNRIPVFEYTPNQVKISVTGSGRADKKQIQEMIKRILNLDEIPRPDDAADGLSIALCHLQCNRWIL